MHVLHAHVLSHMHMLFFHIHMHKNTYMHKHMLMHEFLGLVTGVLPSHLVFCELPCAYMATATSQRQPVVILCDNKNCVAIAHNLCFVLVRSISRYNITLCTSFSR